MEKEIKRGDIYYVAIPHATGMRWRKTGPPSW